MNTSFICFCTAHTNNVSYTIFASGHFNIKPEKSVFTFNIYIIDLHKLFSIGNARNQGTVIAKNTLKTVKLAEWSN